MATSYGYTSRYALTDHAVTIDIPAYGSLSKESITIGGAGDNGQGTCVGQISVTRSQNLWTTEGDPTGSWVHNKNLDKTGTVEIQIRQVSATVLKLIQVCNAFESVSNKAAGTPGITITIDGYTGTDDMGKGDIATASLVQCNDCFIQKVPDQVYGETAAMQTWVFTCGQIKFNPTL